MPKESKGLTDKQAEKIFNEVAGIRAGLWFMVPVIKTADPLTFEDKPGRLLDGFTKKHATFQLATGEKVSVGIDPRPDGWYVDFGFRISGGKRVAHEVKLELAEMPK